MRLTRSPWLATLLLAVGTFVVGTSELIIAGILPSIAADLGVSVSTSGYLVTAYALAFALVTPLVATGTGRFPRRPTLLVCLGVFVLGNMLAVLAASFSWLVLARVVVAASAGVFEVVATAAAAELVPARWRGRAIAVVAGGFSVALFVGVPIGTLVGLAFGWRSVFAGLAVVGCVAALGLLLAVPGGQTQDRTAPERSALGVLRKPQALLALAMTVLVFTGIYIALTYAAVIVVDLAGLPAQTIALALLLAGGGSVLGNAVGGIGADRFGVRWTLIVSGLIMSVGLVLVSLQPVLVVVAPAVMTLGAGAFVPTQQARLVTLAPGAPDFGLALNLAALNVGIAAGAAVGSVLLDAGLLAWLGALGGSVVLLATLLAASTTSDHG